MIRYAKGTAPARLVALSATPGMTWAGLGAADRQPLREALVRDQGGLCAYCQRRIVADDDPRTGRSRMKIEHWAARAHASARQLAWTNMVGVCLGGAPGSPDAGLGAGNRHCDESRGERPLFLHPVEGQGPDPRQHLRYTKNGDVLAAAIDERVESDLDALNLGAARLKRGRAAVFRALLTRLEQAGFSPQELRRLEREHRIDAGTTGRAGAGLRPAAAPRAPTVAARPGPRSWPAARRTPASTATARRSRPGARPGRGGDRDRPRTRPPPAGRPGTAARPGRARRTSAGCRSNPPAPCGRR